MDSGDRHPQQDPRQSPIRDDEPLHNAVKLAAAEVIDERVRERALFESLIRTAYSVIERDTRNENENGTIKNQGTMGVKHIKAKAAVQNALNPIMDGLKKQMGMSPTATSLYSTRKKTHGKDTLQRATTLLETGCVPTEQFRLINGRTMDARVVPTERTEHVVALHLQHVIIRQGEPESQWRKGRVLRIDIGWELTTPAKDFSDREIGLAIDHFDLELEETAQRKRKKEAIRKIQEQLDLPAVALAAGPKALVAVEATTSALAKVQWYDADDLIVDAERKATGCAATPCIAEAATPLHAVVFNGQRYHPECSTCLHYNCNKRVLLDECSNGILACADHEESMRLAGVAAKLMAHSQRKTRSKKAPKKPPFSPAPNLTKNDRDKLARMFADDWGFTTAMAEDEARKSNSYYRALARDVEIAHRGEALRKEEEEQHKSSSAGSDSEGEKLFLGAWNKFDDLRKHVPVPTQESKE